MSAPIQALANLVPANDVRASAVPGQYDAYEIRGGTVTSSVTLAKLPSGFCYISAGEDIEVRGASNPVLTIPDLTLIKMKSGTFLRVGVSGLAGGLRAKGVVFTSAQEDTLGDTNGDR